MRLLFLCLLVCLVGCQPDEPARPPAAPSATASPEVAPLISRIAFGSCAEEYKPQPVLRKALRHDPDVFVWLGDNVYGDTYEMDTLRAKYARLGRKPEFQALRDSTRLLATWDDHDYGWNDSGRHYPHKEASKDIFLDFWQAPPDDPRRQRDGIYTSYRFADDQHTLQLILLDLRTFRDDLRPYEGQPVDTTAFHYGLDYWPYETADSTLLGAAQWTWLEEQLRQPADVRLIATSTQFGISYNGYEAWTNFPHEQHRMLDLIRTTKANGVVFISGDVHYAEISRLPADNLYPIYDVTASGLTSTWHFATPNENRLDGPIMENHFGLIEVDWQPADPTLTMLVYDVDGQERIRRQIPLSTLQFPTP